MKERTQTTNKQQKKSWRPEYPTVGQMKFSVLGYVQQVNAREEVDYIDFKIDNPYVQGNINSINVAVGWDLPQLEAGDYVCIRGNIRSWWDKDIEQVVYTFVATEVTSAKDEKPERPTLKTATTYEEGPF